MPPTITHDETLNTHASRVQTKGGVQVTETTTRHTGDPRGTLMWEPHDTSPASYRTTCHYLVVWRKGWSVTVPQLRRQRRRLTLLAGQSAGDTFFLEADDPMIRLAGEGRLMTRFGELSVHGLWPSGWWAHRASCHFSSDRDVTKKPITPRLPHLPFLSRSLLQLSHPLGFPCPLG